MKLIKPSRLLSVAILAAMASNITHADETTWSDSGWYLGANLGKSFGKIDDGQVTQTLSQVGLSTTSIVNDEHDKGFKLLAGYQFNRNFALEGGYFDLGKFDFTATTFPLGTMDGRIRLKGINFDLVGIIPFTEKFSAFGRVGVTYAEAKDSLRGTGVVTILTPNTRERAVNPKLGVGLQYDFSENWAGRLEAERYRLNNGGGSRNNTDLISVGVVYKFGHKPAPVTPVYIEPARAPVVVDAPPPTPLPAPAPPPRQFVKYTLSANELFAFDSAEVRLPQTKLDEIAQALKSEGSPQRIVITGYTDRLGATAYNQTLSERRALGVKNYLVNQGVGAERLVATGRAEADPVVVCTDKNLQALIKCLTPNRRVEIDEMTIVKEINK